VDPARYVAFAGNHPSHQIAEDLAADEPDRFASPEGLAP
jgi:hypothetical protein